MQNSVAVFDRLEAEASQAIDWRKVGSLRLASSVDWWSEIRRSMTWPRASASVFMGPLWARCSNCSASDRGYS